MTSFPTSKIELHQWANSLLLLVVGFFVTQTYLTIKNDHEVLAKHETRISVVESRLNLKSLNAILPKKLEVETE